MHTSVDVIVNVYEQKCISFITKIVNDKVHYPPNQVTALVHGYFKTVKCSTERM